MGAQGSKLAGKYVDFWRTYAGLDARGEFGVVGAGSIVRCGLVSFLGYWLPWALLKRNLRDKRHLRAAVGFGLASASYRTIRVSISRFVDQKHRSVHEQSPLIAGSIGALVAMLVDRSFVSSLFVIWWCLRALRTLPMAQQISNSQFGPMSIICFATAVIGPAALRAPAENHPQYRKFLQSFFEANKDPMGVFQKTPMGKSIGSVLSERHGGQPIGLWFATWVRAVALKAVRLYGPLNLVWMVLRFPKMPPVKAVVANTLRSSVFLTAYIGSLMFMLLVNSKLVNKSPSRFQLHMWCGLAGGALLLERSSRQVELAWYCLAQALNSIYNHHRLAGRVQPSFALGAAAMMLATGRFMQYHSRHPGRVMHVLFGEKLGRQSQYWSQSQQQEEEKIKDEKAVK